MKHKILNTVIIATIVSCIAIPAISFADQNNPATVQPFEPVDQYAEIEKTAEGLTNYKEEIIEEIDSIDNSKLKDIFTTITFIKPISFADLSKVIDKYHLSVEVVEVRHIVDNERYTTAILFEESLDNIEKQAEQLTDDLDGALKGYIDIYASVDASYLSKLINDELIYLADISGDAATEGKITKDGEVRNEYRFDDGIDDFPQAISWQIEDIGIEKIQAEEIERGIE
jgi:hypothetical protein